MTSVPTEKGESMTDRETLVALMRQVDACICNLCCGEGRFNHSAGILADHLLANGVVVREWIPVTERLPGNEKVLITNGDIVMRGYRRPDGVWKYGVGLDEVWEKLSLRPVTHWMPLPEPPKEGE